MISATAEQLAFIRCLASVMAAWEPQLELTADQVTEIIQHWQEPDVKFVEYAAAVGPNLAGQLLDEMLKQGW